MMRNFEHLFESLFTAIEAHCLNWRQLFGGHQRTASLALHVVVNIERLRADVHQRRELYRAFIERGNIEDNSALTPVIIMSSSIS